MLRHQEESAGRRRIVEGLSADRSIIVAPTGLCIEPADAHNGGPMSRDEILTKLVSLGAISLLHAIQDVEAGRTRRISLASLPGGAAFSREGLGFVRSLRAGVGFSPRALGA